MSENPSPPFACAGIVLAGGKSTRMGLAKASLPFGPELMLQRVVRLLKTVVQPIVVVAAPQQALPPLPADVIMAHDATEGRGPLQGLLAGLSAVQSQADAAYATSCDVPLLVPQFVLTMIELLDDFDIAVPMEGEFPHPLAAVYRTSVVPHIQGLLSQDRLRPAFLYERTRTRQVQVEQLRVADPELLTLRNLNRREDYLAALAEAGFPPQPAILDAFDAPRT